MVGAKNTPAATVRPKKIKKSSPFEHLLSFFDRKTDLRKNFKSKYYALRDSQCSHRVNVHFRRTTLRFLQKCSSDKKFLVEKKWHRLLAEEVSLEFERRKTRKPELSLRQFARDIDLSAGGLSELMRQKARWKISPRRGLKLLEKLRLSPASHRRISLAIDPEQKLPRQLLSSSDHDVFADAHLSPVLFALDLPSHLRSPAQISQLLNLSPDSVEDAFRKLEAKGLVKKEGGAYAKAIGSITTSDQVQVTETGSEEKQQMIDAITQHHRENTELQKRALNSETRFDRDFSSLTFCGSRKKIQFLRDEIRALHARASALMDGEDENEAVFRLSVQLFPIEF